MRFSPEMLWDRGYCFEDDTGGHRYYVKYINLGAMIPYMTEGVIEGIFDFNIVGGYNGIVLVEPK